LLNKKYFLYVPFFCRVSVYFLSPSQNMMEDGIGSDWHPSAITHQKLSKLFVEKITEVLDK